MKGNKQQYQPRSSVESTAPGATSRDGEFVAAQTQLLTSMANTIANMQAQMNQALAPPPPPARHRHREFMSHKPPSFSHSTHPLQADDCIKKVEKMLNIVQCTDREKVLFCFRQTGRNHRRLVGCLHRSS
jgi:hypothetical protein